MRKKRKLRGRAERAALEAAAADAGVEIDEAGEVEEPIAVDSVDAAGVDGESEASADAPAADSDTDTDSDSDSDSDTDTDTDSDSDSEADDADAATRPQAAQLDDDAFTSLIEALLFATDKPLTIARLRQLTRVSDTGRIQQALERLIREHTERGVVLSNISGGYSFRTHSRFSSWVQQLIQGRPVRLSRAQLETLALVAYRQPITRPEIDQIRGVDSAATLKLLLDRNLVRILGKREEVGRPLLYGTTREFLDFFSLNDLRELPTLREYSELSEESRGVVEKMGMELPPVAPAEEPASGGHGDEVPAEALAPELPADVVAPEGVEVPATEPGAGEPGAGESMTDSILGSPDPDNFDDASSDGSMS